MKSLRNQKQFNFLWFPSQIICVCNWGSIRESPYLTFCPITSEHEHNVKNTLTSARQLISACFASSFVLTHRLKTPESLIGCITDKITLVFRSSTETHAVGGQQTHYVTRLSNVLLTSLRGWLNDPNPRQ